MPIRPASSFNKQSTAEEVTEGVSLAGKTIVITGCNSGLGLESARVLSMRGAFIVGTGRTREKAAAALADLGPNPGSGSDAKSAAVACELSEPDSVRAAVASIHGLNRPLDVIMCNAGIMALPERQVKYGIELQFLTNHVGHFIFANGLLDLLNDDGRVVVLSSGAHRRAPDEGITFDDMDASRDYQPWQRYGQTKLANILYARSLHQRLGESGKVAGSLHPGVIKTNLGRYDQASVDALFEQMDPSNVKTIPQGAATQCLLAAHPVGAEAGGRYYQDCQVGSPTEVSQDDALAQRLWDWTEDFVGGL